MQSFVEVIVGVCSEEEAHAHDALDIAWRDRADVADHPAPPLEGNFPVNLLVEIEVARPDHHRTDVVRRAMKQKLLGLIARQTMVGIESSPARVWRSARAHIVGGLAPGMNVKPAHLEPVVAEAGLAQPTSPRLHKGAEGHSTHGLPV